MLVWTEFCQEMFACLEECELAMLALSHSCQRDCSQGKVQKPFWGGRCRTEPVAQLQPHTLLNAMEGMKGSDACYLLLDYSDCGEGPEFHLLSELEQLLAGGGGSKQINSQF